MITRVAWGAVALAVLAFAVFEGVKYGGWAWAGLAAGLIGPDLVFLFALGGKTADSGNGRMPPRLVPAYNLVHRALVAIGFLIVTILLPIAHTDFVPWFVLGLGWLGHIAIDRAVGYRLRDPDGWVRGRRPQPVPTEPTSPAEPM